MIPGRILNATRVLGAPVDWDAERDGPCCGLPVRLELAGGLPTMVSAWQPTPAEIAAIVQGSPVYLRVVGGSHPPVMLWAGPEESGS